MIKKLAVALCILLTIPTGIAQEITQDPENLKTVIFKPSGINRYAPIIQLGEQLKLSFDDLIADEHDYSYRIVHCEIDWTPSRLSETEYISGYSKDRIRDYENSFNTLQPYTNYNLSVPNENTRIKLSGNYLLYILNEDDVPVLSRRFVIYEPKTAVGVAVFKSRNIAQINTHQAVEFNINHPNFRINNPGAEVIPLLMQNNNWDNAIIGLKPQFYRGSQLLYKYNAETSFTAGNEFLYFDSKSIRNSTLNIANVALGDEIYQTYMYTNEERIDAPYTLSPDINGNFVVRILDRGDPNTEADYSNVHFSLKCLEDLKGKEIYISGNYNNWQLNEENKMSYNSETGLYETSMLFKQGFYNYQYLTRSVNGDQSNCDIDGSFYQTENDYTVIVYYKQLGARYTRVIGVGYGNSEKLNN